MPPSSRLSYAAQQVRQLDRDRFVTALFAPPERREALFALYAFNIEVARVRELVSEPLLGQIRLQWWRDAIGALYAGGSVDHPLAGALQPAIRDGHLPQPSFERLLDARLADMDDTPPADLQGMEDYAEGTGASLGGLAMEILGVREEAALRAARHLGIAWALTGLLRAVPFHASARRLYLPTALLSEHGVDAEEIFAGRRPPGLARVGEAVAERARGQLAQGRALRRQVPKAAVPGLLTAPLAERYLDALAKAGGDLMDTRWSMTRPRPIRLTWHALRGRY